MSLNRIGDDCFRLILQYTQIRTMVTASRCSQRTAQVTDHIVTKYLPTIYLNLDSIDLCQRYSKTRMSTIIRNLGLLNHVLYDFEIMTTIMTMTMIMQRSKYLQVLDLCGSNYLGAKGIECLTRFFASIPQLQTLNLAWCNLGLEGMKVLAPRLTSIPQLKNLNLNHNSLGSEGIQVLAPHLVSCPQLRTLNLAGNLIDVEGMRVLAPHLISWPCLRKLNLNKNILGPEGMIVLASHLFSLPRLQTLNLTYNYIRDEGLSFLIPHLVSIPRLKFLDLSDNCLSLTSEDLLDRLQSSTHIHIYS